jgi:hypothetical protein
MQIVIVFVLLCATLSIVVDLDDLPDDPQLIRMVPDSIEDTAFKPNVIEWIPTPVQHVE